MEMDFFDQAAFKIASRFNNDHTRWANKFSFLLLNTKHFLPNVNGEKILLVKHTYIYLNLDDNGNLCEIKNMHCKSISKSFLLKIDFNHKLFCSQVPSNEDFHIFL